MTAFEVFINGHRVCLAGVGENGVLAAIVNWIGGPDKAETFRLSVSGLDTSTDEHLTWKVPTIGVGAEVLVRVLESSSVDLPHNRKPSKRPTTLEEYRKCLQDFTERLSEGERQELLEELVADLEGKKE